MADKSRWYGPHVAFGLHYDLHAQRTDPAVNLYDDPDELLPVLEQVGAQFAQCDSRSLAGFTSWPSRTPHATVAPGLKGDGLRLWREATRELGIPLHAHFCCLCDHLAAEEHPEWRWVPNPTLESKPLSEMPFLHICPRSAYAEKLIIPLMCEMVETYDLDGFWVDGEIWIYDFCYCERCQAEFRRRTGIAAPPTETSDPNWVRWVAFQRDSLHEFQARYIAGVRARHPQVRFTSDYCYSLRDPGEPAVDHDWISADVWKDIDEIRGEARFYATRGRPWDIMIWAFDTAVRQGDQTTPSNYRSVAEMQRQAAHIVAQGGGFQIYENPSPLRDGRMVPWRLKRIGEAGAFYQQRQPLCVGSTTLPQVAILNSEAHLHTQPAKNLWDYDVTPVRGALYSLLEQQFSVDILDEWALWPVLDEYPLVVVPEQDHLSEEMVAALKDYCRRGGRLLLSGAAAFERFGGEFLGVASEGLEARKVYYLPGEEGMVAVDSPAWRLVRPLGARMLGQLGKTPLVDAELLPNAALAVHAWGAGRVAYFPGAIFSYYERDRRSMLRDLIGQAVEALEPLFDITVEADPQVDVVLRRKDDLTLVHLINRKDGPVSGITLTAQLEAEPEEVWLAFEEGDCDWEWKDGELRVEVERVDIHAAVVIR